MNLEKMLETQNVLDDRIIAEKGLEGQDLFPNTVLSLQVELGEFANEGRWFKHWSNDREPRTKLVHICPVCEGSGDENWPSSLELLADGQEANPFEPCIECNTTGELGESNPLLEEYADGIHFFLSIANQKGWQDSLYIYEEQLDEDEFDGDLTGWYLEMVYYLNRAYMEVYPEDKKIADFQKNAYYFRMAWICFLNLGINGFNFTEEQIEEAYFAKNKINHQRQESGY